jgi:hypothetical protein
MYFLTVNSIFSGMCLTPISVIPSDRIYRTGSSTLAGITAAVTANVVLFAYIYVAWKEDQEDRQAEKPKSDSKKAQ